MASGSGYMSDDNFYGENEDEGEVEIVKQPCTNCGRNFNIETLTKHINICTNLKERKTFNSKKQRMAELEKIPIETKAPPPNGNKSGKKKNWRWQHEQLMKNIRAARGAKTSNRSNPPTVNPDYTQCPNCKRRFNETAAERHIEFCKEQKSRIPKALDPKYSDKKEKQDKRSSYKPPLPGSKKNTSGKEAAIKPRVNSTTNRTSYTVKKNASPSSSKSSPSSSKCVKSEINAIISDGQRDKEKTFDVQEEQRDRNLINRRNERYSKSTERLSSGDSSSENEKRRCRKEKKIGSEPKWFEDLKRNDPEKQTKGKMGKELDDVDSGMDLDENYLQITPVAKKNSGHNSPEKIIQNPPRARRNEIEFLVQNSSSKPNSSRRQRFANFCHDCGTKYPIPNARFCCDCGVQRMTFAEH